MWLYHISELLSSYYNVDLHDPGPVREYNCFKMCYMCSQSISINKHLLCLSTVPGAFTHCFRFILHLLEVLTRNAVLWRIKMKPNAFIMKIMWIVIQLQKTLEDYIVKK